MDRIPEHVSAQAVDTTPGSSSAVQVAPPEVHAVEDRDEELVLVGSRTAALAGTPPGAFSTPGSAPPAPDAPELPFPPIVSLPPPARPLPLFGPMGRRRSTVAVALLSAVTLGVYALVWHRRVNREMEEFDPKLHARPLRSSLALAIPWLIGVLATLAGAALILTDHFAVHLPFDPHVTLTQSYALLGGLVAIPYLVLVLPFSAVAVVMTLERLRCVEEHVGLTPDRQVRAVGGSLLLLIPVAGGLILLGVEQRRLNSIWESVAPTGPRAH